MIFQASDEYFAMHTEVACWLLRLKEIKKKQVLLWKDLNNHPYKYNSTYGSIIPPTLQLRQLATMCPQLQ